MISVHEVHMSQGMYVCIDLTLRRVRVTIYAVEKQ